MLHVLAHDLRAPLRAMRCFAELLEDGSGVTPEERRQYLKHIADGARELDGMLTDLHAYAGIEPQMEPVEARALCELACRELEPLLRERAAELALHPLPRVRVRASLLAMIFRELIKNALIFSPGTPRIEIHGDAEGERVVIAVHDHGIGIAEADRERVFGLFVRLHAADAYPGRGAGLARVQRAVQAHHGRVWIEPGSPGTIVKFALLPA